MGCSVAFFAVEAAAFLAGFGGKVYRPLTASGLAVTGGILVAAGWLLAGGLAGLGAGSAFVAGLSAGLLCGAAALGACSVFTAELLVGALSFRLLAADPLSVAAAACLGCAFGWAGWRLLSVLAVFSCRASCKTR